MTHSFAILAALTLLSAILALSLRNLMHCVVCLVVTLTGVAALYLQLGVGFVSLAQLLLFAGIVGSLVVLAIRRTRNGGLTPQKSILSRAWWMGLIVAPLVFLCLASAIKSSNAIPRWSTLPPKIPVRIIGQQLVNRPESKPESDVLPLLLTSALLAAALIGVFVIPRQETKTDENQRNLK